MAPPSGKLRKLLLACRKAFISGDICSGSEALWLSRVRHDVTSVHNVIVACGPKVSRKLDNDGWIVRQVVIPMPASASKATGGGSAIKVSVGEPDTMVYAVCQGLAWWCGDRSFMDPIGEILGEEVRALVAKGVEMAAVDPPKVLARSKELKELARRQLTDKVRHQLFDALRDFTVDEVRLMLDEAVAKGVLES